MYHWSSGKSETCVFNFYNGRYVMGEVRGKDTDSNNTVWLNEDNVEKTRAKCDSQKNLGVTVVPVVVVTTEVPGETGKLRVWCSCGSWLSLTLRCGRRDTTRIRRARITRYKYERLYKEGLYFYGWVDPILPLIYSTTYVPWTLVSFKRGLKYVHRPFSTYSFLL